MLLVLCTPVFLSACNEEAPHMSMPPAVVQVMPVSVGAFHNKSDFLGTAKSRKSVTLSPRIDGNITQILVTSGQLVQSGQKIMQVDSRMQTATTSAVEAAADSVEADMATTRATLASLESTLKSREANVEYTRRQHARYQNLQRDGAVSQADLDQWTNSSTTALAERDAILQQIEAQKMTIRKMERNHKQALANFQAQKEQLKYYEISAPFTGVIGDIPVKVGDHVSTSTPLTTITENHPLEVYIPVPAEKASIIQPGMKVDIIAADGRKFGESKVIFVAPTVDSSSQTVLVKTLYPNTKSELRAEQTVKAQIVWDVHNVMAVPTKAVLQAAGKFFVFTAVENKGKLTAHQSEIEVYGIEGSSYQIKSGLKPTDKVVTTGIQRLADGAPIVAKSEISEKKDASAH